MKQILIVEDNVYTLQRLKDIAQEFDARVFAVTELSEAYRIACEFSIDVFLLDVKLSQGDESDASGVRFAMSIRQIEKYKRAAMIFVTCLEDPGMALFGNLHCFQHIEKPFDDSQVRDALKEVWNLPEVEDQRKKYIHFRIQKRNVIQKVEDIVYIEKINRIFYVHTIRDCLHIHYMSMSEIIDELSGTRLYRCSRNTLVNLDYVVSVDVVNLYVVLRDDWGRIEIGTKYKQNILKACGNI